MQGDRAVIRMGVVAPALRRMFDLKQPVYFAEIDFELIARAAKKNAIAVAELSKFPEVKRDLALLVDKNVTFSQLRDIAFATEKKLLKRAAAQIDHLFILDKLDIAGADIFKCLDAS